MPATAAPAADGPPAIVSHLLYLHGFRSSPRSFKAQRVRAWVQAHRPDLVLHCPQLPPSPREAMDGVLHHLADWPLERSAVIGSSLGGFYATVVAQRTGCPAVLLNPAVDPARDLAAYIGQTSAFDDPQQRFFFRAEYIDELRALDPGPLSRLQRYLAVIAKGDEVLDWREMQSRYAGAALRLIEGSDHALSDFDQHLPHIVRFLHLDNRP